jgi:hypothetical protein
MFQLVCLYCISASFLSLDLLLDRVVSSRFVLCPEILIAWLNLDV